MNTNDFLSEKNVCSECYLLAICVRDVYQGGELGFINDASFYLLLRPIISCCIKQCETR